MSHPRWPGFDSKTGNPRFDNDSRNLNRRMWRETKARFKVHAAGRKRKKLLKRVEGTRYIQIIAAVMNDLARKDHRHEH